MTISLLFGCAQIETCIGDMDMARDYMESVLGAGRIEEKLSAEIANLFPPDVGYRVEHLDCGRALFQINQPSPRMVFNGQASTHQAYMETIGPTVSNLNYFVDDAVHAHKLLTEMGAKTRITGPSSTAPSLTDYGPDNTRPGANQRNFYFMGSRDLLGFDLELMEPNFNRFTKQTVQYPAFVEPRPQVSDGNLELLRLRIVVPDLEESLQNIVKIFAPASRSKPYGYKTGTLGKSFRIGLGGMELEYCQPLTQSGELAEFLQKFGPGTTSVAFAAQDIDHVRTKAEATACPHFKAASDPLGMGEDVQSICYQAAARKLTGFDVVLEPVSL